MTLHLRAGIGAATLAALAACAPVPDAAPRNTERVATAPVPASAPAAETPSALSQYFVRVQERLVSQGLMRTDDGADIRFTAAQLAENFIRIALFDEYVVQPSGLQARDTETRLRRWEQPIRLALHFGSSVPDAQRVADRAYVSGFAARLSDLTRVPIQIAPQSANFHVLIVNENERRAIGPTLRGLMPEISESVVRYTENLPPEQLCLVLGSFDATGGRYRTAVAVIRAEHPLLLRQACVQEEMAQGMGLANDSPHARPSIFNDDEEFAFLTVQDRLLLKMLYDPRLESGMSAAEATPIARQLAAELLRSNHL